MPMTVEVYGCATCPFTIGTRRCRLDTFVRRPLLSGLRGAQPPDDCPLRDGSVRHVLCDPDHPDSKLMGAAHELAE